MYYLYFIYVYAEYLFCAIIDLKSISVRHDYEHQISDTISKKVDASSEL